MHLFCVVLFAAALVVTHVEYGVAYLIPPSSLLRKTSALSLAALQRPVVPACTDNNGDASEDETGIPSDNRNDGGGDADEDKTCSLSDDDRNDDDDASEDKTRTPSGDRNDDGDDDGSASADESGRTADTPSDDCSDADDDWECWDDRWDHWGDRWGDYDIPLFATTQPRDVSNAGQQRGPPCGTVASAFRSILFAFQRVVGPIYVAAGFETQPQRPARYLQRVTVTVRSTLSFHGPSGPFNLTLWDDDGSPNGAPRAPLRSVASNVPGPSSTTGENITVVLAPYQVVLAPSTRYWLVMSLADPADLREVNWYTSAKRDSVIGDRDTLLHLAVSGDAGATWSAHSILYTTNFAVASCIA